MAKPQYLSGTAALLLTATAVVALSFLVASGPSQREQDLTAENRQLRGQAGDLESQLNELGERLAAAERSADEAASRAQELEAEHSELEQRLAAAEAHSTAAEDALGAAQARLEAVDLELAENAARLTKAIDASSDTGSRLEVAEAGLAESQTVADAARQALAGAETRVVTLEQDLAEAESRSGADRQALAEREAAHEATRQLLAEAEARVVVFQQALADSDTRMAAAEQERDTALARVRSLVQERDALAEQLELARGRLLEAATALEAAGHERADIQAALGEAEAREVAALSELAELTAQVTGLDAEIAGLTAEIAGLTAEAAASAADAAAGREAARQALAERDQLKRLVDDLGTHSADLDDELDEAKTELSGVQDRALQLTGRLSELLERESGLQQTTQAQQDELAAVRAALEAAQGDVARLTGARGIYTVQVGDSLSTIAAFFYRAGSRWPDILQANGHLISDPDLIFSGMVLIIPN